ncbi:hypothetical protein HNP55_003892 [Paucibacter oligotrophus]|uniref:Meckel syndrome type 1 protein n=1 Tax=Roseateles oligotrophus TaxID=1769250 RepID=A0A840LED8_9BURK|nr:hypothetical protein [Roseateles oligotrophus]MBB4845345.1 hypothetical protein [Roseateles oligotrophus]
MPKPFAFARLARHVFQARLLSFAAAPGRRPRATKPRAKPLPQAQLKQSLLLAALLHVWLVLLLGNAPGGTAKPGEGVWGRLNISLRGPENGDPGGAPPLPEDNAGPPGPAKQARFGGAPRPLPAADQPQASQPGAARLGAWQAAPAEAQTEAPTQPQPEPRPNLAAEAVPAPRLVSAVPAVAALPSQALPAPAPLNVPKFEALPAAPEAPAQLKAFDAAAGPAVQRAPARASLKPGAAQTAPQALELAPALPALQGRPEPAPVPVPVVAAEAPPQPSKVLPEPAALPSLAAQPLQAPPVLKPLASSGLERAPALAPAPAALDPGAAQASAEARTPAAVPPQGRLGAPDAGSRLGHDVATPPSASASAPQAPLQLNLSLPPRPRGGELSGRGSRGVLDLMPTPPERKSKLSQEMENAAKQDCRKAYAEGGLLAALPLAADALRDKGCRW